MAAHILIAEDDPKQAELLRRYLEREGHRTAVVYDGRAALAEVRRRDLDVLLLDLMLPRMDGPGQLLEDAAGPLAPGGCRADRPWPTPGSGVAP